MPPTAPATLATVRRWIAEAEVSSASDPELLGRFVRSRDEVAFAALLDRHGSMVLGVARRITGELHSAEDILQATFIALARQARSLRYPPALPAWLHRTATRLALTSVRARRRRERSEAMAPARSESDTLAEISGRELVAVLDEELARLPETLRSPLLLCCLEGRSHEEAAALLGWSPGSVRGRLERG